MQQFHVTRRTTGSGSPRSRQGYRRRKTSRSLRNRTTALILTCGRQETPSVCFRSVNSQPWQGRLWIGVKKAAWPSDELDEAIVDILAGILFAASAHPFGHARPRPDTSRPGFGVAKAPAPPWAFGALEGLLAAPLSWFGRARQGLWPRPNLVPPSSRRAFRYAEVVVQDHDQLPTFFACLAQQLDLAALARHVVERELAVLPFNVSLVPFSVRLALRRQRDLVSRAER